MCCNLARLKLRLRLALGERNRRNEKVSRGIWNARRDASCKIGEVEPLILYCSVVVFCLSFGTGMLFLRSGYTVVQG